MLTTPVFYISALLVIALIAAALFYFQAANRLSLAEQWLQHHADLRQWHKNTALTRRLMRAIIGKQAVSSPRLLRTLQRRFYLLLIIASASLVWTVGLLLSLMK